MEVGGVLHGDPLEASALEGIRWDWNATSHTARPRSGGEAGDGGGVGGVGSKPASAVSKGDVGGDAATDGREEDENNVSRRSKKGSGEVKDAAEKTGLAGVAGDGSGGGDSGGGGVAVAVAVWRRYAFSSQLQRMSVVAEVSGVGGHLAASEEDAEVSHCCCFACAADAAAAACCKSFACWPVHTRFLFICSFVRKVDTGLGSHARLDHTNVHQDGKPAERWIRYHRGRMDYV